MNNEQGTLMIAHVASGSLVAISTVLHLKRVYIYFLSRSIYLLRCRTYKVKDENWGIDMARNKSSYTSSTNYSER
jgi:hypothetical protein